MSSPKPRQKPGATNDDRARRVGANGAKFAPDKTQIGAFVNALFRHADKSGWISFAAFYDGENKVLPLSPVRISDALGLVTEAAYRAAHTVANQERPATFAPPICTFNNPRRRRDQDIANGLALSVEIDSGDAFRAVAKLESIFGDATVIMLSGTVRVENGEERPNLHAHWRLTVPTRRPDEHKRLRAARELATRLIKSDATAKPISHPLRWGGTWNKKVAGKEKIAMVLVRPDMEIDLDAAYAALAEAAGAAELAKNSPSDRTAPKALVASAMAAIPNAGTEVHYADWIRMGYAVWRATRGKGYEIFRAWSEKSDKHDDANTRKTWEAIGKSVTGGAHENPNGAGTIFHFALENRWAWPAEGEERQTGGAEQREPAEWDEPFNILSDPEITGPPVLRPEHIPAAIAGFAFDTAARMGVDPAAVAMAALTALSAVVSQDWRIQPKRLDDRWTTTVILWTALVGDASILKSPIMRAVKEPLERLEGQAASDHDEKMAAYGFEKRIYDRATKDSKDKPIGGEPVRPRRKRYLVKSTTFEALTEILRGDAKAEFEALAKKVLIYQDEMSEWVANFDRYRKGGKGGGDRPMFLRLYDGDEDSIDRIGRGNAHIPSWAAGFLGGIQPDPIREIANKSVADGLLPRFILMVSERQERGIDRVPDEKAIARYESLFSALSALRPPEVKLSGKHQPVVLHEDARHCLDESLALIDAIMRMPDASGQLKSALGKWSGLWARLALLFHLIDAVDKRQPPGVVSEATAGKVTALMRGVLLPNFLRADLLMFKTEETGHVEWIAGHILAGDLTRIAVRDIVGSYRALRAPHKRDELQLVMANLEALGWLRDASKYHKRHPTAWLVNPKIHDGRFAEQAKREKAQRSANADEARTKFAERRAETGKARRSPV